MKPEDIKKSQILDHLGLISVAIKKLKIDKYINEALPVQKNYKTTMGERVTAMILNGLGFIDSRLYIFPEFLENKPIEKLIRKDLSFNDFNDDALGRCLDAIHNYGTSKLYSELALKIATKGDFIGRSIHLDTTTLSVYGEYDSPAIKAEKNNENAPTPEYGYAKNKRFDLKQMTLLLATTGKAAFPLHMEALSGNQSDSNSLESAAKRIQKICEGLEAAKDMLFVGDAAMYSACVENTTKLLWISRVPSTLKIAKAILQQTDIEWILDDNGYKYYAFDQEYKKSKQKWVLIFSQQAYDREMKTLEKSIKREKQDLEKEVWHLGNLQFGCEKDAINHLKKVQKDLKFHQISSDVQKNPVYLKKGRPSNDSKPDDYKYKLACVLSADEEKIEAAKLTKGKFILATNQLDKSKLPDNEVLSTYKEQQNVERGFQFIKDDAFEVDSIFLKKPGRIEALMMIMVLCLMVYGYTQYFIRNQLKNSGQTIRSQTGKETQNPSAKWIYFLMHGIHVLEFIREKVAYNIVLNMNEIRKKIVALFGKEACQIYDVEF